MAFLYGDLPLILCGVVGLAMLLTEAFMPGFGIAGILGIVLEILTVYSAWLTHGPVFALVLLVILIALIVLLIWLSYRSALRGRLSRSALVLQNEEVPKTENAAKTLMAYRNQTGITVTPLRPAGIVEVDGVRVNAAGGGDLIPKGTKVLITGAEGDHVTVQPMSQE